MSAPKAVRELVDRYKAQRESYISQKYNETQVRREFIDPLFKALGWDIDNAEGFAEAYKDVVHEDALKIGSSNRAPDYSFRIGGIRKFFLEAKKPSVSLTSEVEPAYQLRRYGWSAKLGVSVLTNFEELAIYDCRVRPSKNDKSHTARIGLFNFDDYLTKWDEIHGIFSKEAILKGAFDRYTSNKKLKKGTVEVDDQFLSDIEIWRELLAKSFAANNSDLSQSDLNFSVQATIDRIVFLRISEDRGIEDYGQLQALSKKPHVYKELGKLFLRADDKYNSGLFHFRSEKERLEAHDSKSLGLSLDDKPLREIISGLYYPDSPYEFSVIGADILGQVYEQFLGKIIRLTPSHRAVVEEKPEVKKAGGVYYTPTYIVDYIIQNTIGAWIEEKSIKQAASLRVLDPACGSGSFLISAYQFLLDWYAQQYSQNPSAYKTKIYKDDKNEWRLTLKERKRILTQHIFGVDVDAQAVEVAKLSLLLKVLERESTDSLKRQLDMFQERALPDLGNNIKCGNSLIGKSFFASQQMDLLGSQGFNSVNTFEWSTEFAHIIKAGGFDVIIGNPPYVNAWTMYESSPELRDYLNQSEEYESADKHWDMYVLFLEKSSKLLKQAGLLSFIIPFSYCIQKYASKSRAALSSQFCIRSILDLRKVRVFKNVPVITIIPVLEKIAPKKNKIKILGPDREYKKMELPKIDQLHEIDQQVFRSSNEAMWRLDWNPTNLEIVHTVDSRCIDFGDISFVNYGAQMSSRTKGGFGKDFVLRDKRVTNTCKKTISGRNLYRYSAEWDGQYVEWALSSKMYGPRDTWFFETPKLMIRDITGTHRLEICADETKLYCDHTILCALRACDIEDHKEFSPAQIELSKKYSLELLLGLLNSRLSSAYYYWTLTGEGVRTGGGFHTYPSTVRVLPLFDVSKASKSELLLLKEIETGATKLLELKASAHRGGSAMQNAATEKQIAAIDDRIDTCVYKLFNLTAKQQAAIEKATS